VITSVAVDDKWFKQRQKIAGVTADDIARELGKDRSLVSRIYIGRQKMKLDEAKVFSRVLGVPLNEILDRAGLLDQAEAQPLSPGFSESDATPFAGQEEEQRRVAEIGKCLGQKPGVDIWRVKNAAMALAGFLPGDFLLVDTLASERVRAHDTVIAQIYNWNSGTATTVLRRLEPPVLVAASLEPENQGVYVVDGNNVVVKGKVVASWRI
jgi:transcriptional regulator with XRE-family HTH domain